jgi:hypothetical protein
MYRSLVKEYGKLAGFSDGSDIYLKRKEGLGIPAEFVRIDNYGEYGYFEDLTYLSTGSTTVPIITYNLINLNTGEVKRIDRKHLRDLLLDEPEILEDFDHESQKDKKIKEYLVKYLEKKTGISPPVRQE